MFQFHLSHQQQHVCSMNLMSRHRFHCLFNRFASITAPVSILIDRAQVDISPENSVDIESSEEAESFLVI